MASEPKLTSDEAVALRRLASLQKGWLGIRPGSSVWPFLELETDAGSVDGRHIYALKKLGFVSCAPTRLICVLQEPDNIGLPEINVAFDWGLTPAGHCAAILIGGTDGE